MKLIVLLRGINVGARSPRVPMADLRQFALDLGFAEPRTVIQSGNLVMEGEDEDHAKLEARLEAEAISRLGVTIDFIVRTPSQWRAAIAANPFAEAAEKDPGHLLVFFLKANPAPGTLDELRDKIVGRELVKLHGQQAYIVYPDGMGESRLTNTLIEQRLGVRGTGRNWNTVRKIAELVET